MDFLSAALPWICIGLLLAIFFAQSTRKKKESKKNENYGAFAVPPAAVGLRCRREIHSATCMRRCNGNCN